MDDGLRSRRRVCSPWECFTVNVPRLPVDKNEDE
jgi:hypothetical protein